MNETFNECYMSLVNQENRPVGAARRSSIILIPSPTDLFFYFLLHILELQGYLLFKI